MTNPIVLSFDPDGKIEYTRNSEFMPFEGRGVMHRVTDIRKDPDGQSFYIHWMAGPCEGVDHTYGMSISVGVISTCPAAEMVMKFPTYEAAVAHEIEVLNAYRRKGVSFYDIS